MSDIKTAVQKKRDYSFDLIRCISTLAIVFFHYSYTFIEFSITGSHASMLKFVNGDWGGVFVAVFFMLSGAALHYNYGEKLSLGKFYVKRWLSIFPMFYVAWVIMYLINSNKYGTYLWGGPKSNFWFTFLGMDGYLMHWGLNYYCLGEWFLGAIICLYLLYPLLRILFNRFCIITTIGITICFVVNLYKDLFTISDAKSLMTCVMDFWIGMLLVRYKDKINTKVLLAAVSAAIVFIIWKLPVKEVIASTVVGMAFFIILTFLSGYIMNKRISVLIRFVSRYSYGIFLVHHVILYFFMEKLQGREIGFLQSIVMFLGQFAVILGVGLLLTRAVNFFLVLPNKILSNKS